MSFKRHVGAPADLKELEYIAALHQSSPLGRENGLVSSLDIKVFLKSRYGLEITHTQAIDIVRDFGGGVLPDEVLKKILERDAVQRKKEHKSGRDITATLRHLIIKNQPNYGALKSKIQNQAKLINNSLGIRGRRGKGDDKYADADDEYGISLPKGNEHDTENDNRGGGDVTDPDGLEDTEDDDNVDEQEKESFDDENKPEEYLDIVQISSVLFIPFLARSASEETQLQRVDPPEVSLFTTIRPLKCLWNYINNKMKQSQYEERQSLRPKPQGLIPNVLDIMLASVDDTEGFIGSPVVNAELVRSLLMAHGEHERAEDDDLIDRMVQVAQSPSGRLDSTAFVNALTYDLKDWVVGSEDRFSTYFRDVFGHDRIALTAESKKIEDKTKLEAESSSDEENGEGKKDSMEHGIEGKSETESHIKELSVQKFHGFEFSFDDHASTTIAVVIWLFFVAAAFVYTALLTASRIVESRCSIEGKQLTFGCMISSRIWTWAILAVILIVLGFILVIPLSSGNDPANQSFRRTALTLFVALAYILAPFLGIRHWKANNEPPYTDAEKVIEDERYIRIMWWILVSGLLLCSLFVLQAVRHMFDGDWVRNNPILSVLVAPSDVRAAARLKKAATRKINKMMANASALQVDTGRFSMRRSTRSHVDSTLRNYVLLGNRVETAGGLFWTWKQILSGRLFDTEGIWIHTRLIIIQVVQVGIMLIIGFTLTSIAIDMANRAERAAENVILEGLPDWVSDWIPTRREVEIALYPPTGVAILVCLTLFLTYLPSVVSTVLQYRSGQIASLGSPYFQKYRMNVDLVYQNIANASYAMLGSAYLSYAIFAAIIFLFSWEYSRDFMLLLVAWGLGLTITIALKMLFTKTCRRTFFRSFYRTKPLSANVSTLALECWFIALGGGVMVGRLIQFLLAAAFWVGRVDVPFLSPDVRVGSYGFDYVPTNFVKEILLHEAHRHPYIERLGGMYMMKLRYKDSFCSEAGACWRQLFVAALMPWLMKRRVYESERGRDIVWEQEKKDDAEEQGFSEYAAASEDDEFASAREFDIKMLRCDL